MKRICYSITILIFVEAILVTLELNVSHADSFNTVYNNDYYARQKLVGMFFSYIFFQVIFLIISLFWRYIYPKKGISPAVFFLPTYCFAFTGGLVGILVVTAIFYFINKELKKTSFFTVKHLKNVSELNKTERADREDSLSQKTDTNCKHEIFSEYKSIDKTHLHREQSYETKPEAHTTEKTTINNTEQPKIDETDNICMFYNIPNELSLSSDNAFEISFRGLNVSDSITWKCSAGLKIVKAEFEIGHNLLATASFKTETSGEEIPLISIVVNYQNRNYVANYIRENDHFLLNY